jgi:hypothetical protein
MECSLAGVYRPFLALLAGSCARLLGCGFPIRLLACVNRRTELVFLLRNVVATAIHPGACLFARLAGTIGNRVTTLLGRIANLLPGLVSGAWGVKNADCCANTQSRKKPQETAAIVISHDCLPLRA